MFRTLNHFFWSILTVDGSPRLCVDLWGEIQALLKILRGKLTLIGLICDPEMNGLVIGVGYCQTIIFPHKKLG
ncbi:Uncharacterised protein [Klebsiella pneumoniae]|nr:Uncharacterised protein [Klebsiella pneumoniae]